MFYFFSKLLDFILQPSFWVFLLIVIAFFKKSKRKKFIGIALLVFFVFGNSHLYNFAMDALETEPLQQNEYLPNIEAALLLGGYGKFGHQRNSLEFNEASDRLNECLALYHSKKIKKIIVLSGASSSAFPEQKEAVLSRSYLLRCGVDSKDLIIDSSSLNTFQNAENAKKIIDESGMKGPFYLVTSAFHMRRAKSCFDSQKISTIPLATDYYSSKEAFDIEYHILPNTQTLVDWKIIFKEIIGYWVYDIKGYID